jgi:hypothetical protein
MELPVKCKLSFQKAHHTGRGLKISFTEYFFKEKLSEKQVYGKPAMAKYSFGHERRK